ncbi:MAG: lipid-A-disaccharide synthase [Caulobacteraceae bacterium]
MNRPLCVMLVAAEASGDKLGGDLARVLKARLGDGVRFVGVGGERMAAQGVDSPFPIAELSILGLFEGLRAYPRVRRRAAETAQIALREKSDIAVLIDSWGFTLRVAQGLRKLDPSLPIVKYVAPQVWASRPGRAKTLAATVDRLLSIHSFDAPYFEAEGLPTTFVGNSSLRLRSESADPGRLRRHIGAGAADPILLVLPGSRPAEIARLTPPFADAVRRLRASHPGLHVVIPLASTVAAQVKAASAADPTLWPGVWMIEDDGLKADAMLAGTVALACSGSVTTELALNGCPMVVGYRLGGLTHLILKRLITTKYITLFNIAAGAEIAPEFVQQACTGEALARAVAQRLDDPDLREGQIAAQNAALDKMGRAEIGDPAERAADAVMDLLRERRGAD